MARPITQNTKEFLLSLKRFEVDDHVKKMVLLTRGMDSIRRRSAESFIVPRRVSKSISKLSVIRKRQPSHPSRLTERTGLLKRVLGSRGGWKIPKTYSVARLKASKHLLFWVRPQLSGGVRTYLARLSIVPRGKSSIRFRIAHETRGVRGKIRKFLEPAINQERVRFRRGFQEIVGRSVKV